MPVEERELLDRNSNKNTRRIRKLRGKTTTSRQRQLNAYLGYPFHPTSLFLSMALASTDSPPSNVQYLICNVLTRLKIKGVVRRNRAIRWTKRAGWGDFGSSSTHTNDVCGKVLARFCHLRPLAVTHRLPICMFIKLISIYTRYTRPSIYPTTMLCNTACWISSLSSCFLVVFLVLSICDLSCGHTLILFYDVCWPVLTLLFVSVLSFKH